MKKDKLFGIIVGLVVVVIAVLVLCFGIAKKIEVADMTLIVDEPAKVEYTTEGLDPTKIDSIDYVFENTTVQVTDDGKLLATEIGDPMKCKLVIKSGYKKWVGKFYISTTYRPVEFKSGEIVVGKEGECPMEAKNTANTACYLYLKSIDGGDDYAVMIGPGKTSKTKVPVGSYTLYAAYADEGQDWYGPAIAFGGMNARYYKRSTELGFANIDGNITGFKFELADAEGGNLSLKTIDYKAFPKKKAKKKYSVAEDLSKKIEDTVGEVVE